VEKDEQRIIIRRVVVPEDSCFEGFKLHLIDKILGGCWNNVAVHSYTYIHSSHSFIHLLKKHSMKKNLRMKNVLSTVVLVR
jgi:hypothetical protein